MTTPTHTDVLILGAGAAGLMCAFESGRRNRRVILFDHADRVGKKILISGGGRSNFTNLHTRPENFISENPHFAKSALARFTTADMVALIERHNIPYHEKTLGQLFCDRSAHDLVKALERECADANVRILTGTRISSVSITDSPKTKFRVETSSGTILAESLVIATGGLSIPKMGATGLGYEIAAQFGHRIVPCRPALVPFTLNPADLADWNDLSGLSAEVVASTGGKNAPDFREKFLITHRGLSGPAVLQISSYWRPGEPIALDLAPGLAPGRTIARPLLVPNARRDPAALFAILKEILPARMAERWLALNPPSGWTNAALAAFESRLHAWQITPAGTEGYTKAEVTAGGVDTRDLDARTLQSRLVPGLFFIGEVVDVTGWLGGYNFQWAWASAVSAAAAT
jgi:predicted Rossmann fold flavoprotein